MALLKTRTNTIKNCAIILAAGAMLSGCSVVSDALWPSLTGEPSALQLAADGFGYT